MLEQGMTRAEIARQLHIRWQGVNYHYDQLNGSTPAISVIPIEQIPAGGPYARILAALKAMKPGEALKIKVPPGRTHLNYASAIRTQARGAGMRLKCTHVEGWLYIVPMREEL